MKRGGYVVITYEPTILEDQIFLAASADFCSLGSAWIIRTYVACIMPMMLLHVIDSTISEMGVLPSHKRATMFMENHRCTFAER